MTHQISSLGWNFNNSYLTLPSHAYTQIAPTASPQPQLTIVNLELAAELGLSLQDSPKQTLADIFSGNILPDGSTPIAQAYAGHQFGHFTMLGDGRAHLLGEHITPQNQRMDIQLKGSGKTAYSRRGDGRAALGPMLREYLMSEAMHALAIPTTRSLAVVTTGEAVQRETSLTGAILTRVASSHIRVGTFEYFAAHNDKEDLKKLADYTINRHYPTLNDSNTPYQDLLKAVMQRQIELIVNWLRVGFIHGVMNTDNMSISGETIDYGPCAFMDSYDPQTVFSSIDHKRRYAYANQPHSAQWNLARFAESLLPLLDADLQKSVAIAEEIVESFSSQFQAAWLSMMRHKVGLSQLQSHDESLISTLLQWMQHHHVDYTNLFRDLSHSKLPNEEYYQTTEFQNWYQRWQKRLQLNDHPIEVALATMRTQNPTIIPRNHHVDQALRAAEEESNMQPFNTLLQAVSDPYCDHTAHTEFQTPPTPQERIYQTFCGT